MLVNLRIHNFLLISETDILCHPGLNIITGITGGGKSLILKALDFLLGSRASADLIYPGRDSAEVSSVFRISSAAAECIRETLGIETDEDSTLILRRVYRKDRTNLCYINSVPVRVGDLKWIGTLLVDYLAQNHQLRLQKAEEQLAILDSFAGIEHLRTEYSEVLTHFKRLQEEYLEEQKQIDSRKEETDRLSEELADLNSLQPEENEDEDLKRDIAVFEHIASILSSFEHAVNSLYENEQSAYDTLHAVLKVIGNIEEKPDELKSIEQEITDLSDSISAAADSMRRYADSTHFDGRNMEEMKERFYALQKAEDRFGKHLEGLISYWQSLPEKIDRLKERTKQSKNLKQNVMRAGSRCAVSAKNSAPNEPELHSDSALLWSKN